MTRNHYILPKTGPGAVNPALSPYPPPKSWDTVLEVYFTVMHRVRSECRPYDNDPGVSRKLFWAIQKAMGNPPEVWIPDLSAVYPDEVIFEFAKAYKHPSKRTLLMVLQAFTVAYRQKGKKIVAEAFDTNKIFKAVRKWKKSGPDSYEVVR